MRFLVTILILGLIGVEGCYRIPEPMGMGEATMTEVNPKNAPMQPKEPEVKESNVKATEVKETEVKATEVVTPQPPKPEPSTSAPVVRKVTNLETKAAKAKVKIINKVLGKCVPVLKINIADVALLDERLSKCAPVPLASTFTEIDRNAAIEEAIKRCLPGLPLTIEGARADPKRVKQLLQKCMPGLDMEADKEKVVVPEMKEGSGEAPKDEVISEKKAKAEEPVLDEDAETEAVKKIVLADPVAHAPPVGY